MLNGVSRFHLVIDVIDRVPKLRTKAAHLKEEMKNDIIDNMNYAHEHGTDRPELANWTWPYECAWGACRDCLGRLKNRLIKSATSRAQLDSDAMWRHALTDLTNSNDGGGYGGTTGLVTRIAVG